MSMGLPAYTSVGNGTLTSNMTANSVITVTPSANVLAGDLVVCVASWAEPESGPLTSFVDSGDGWVILFAGVVNMTSIILAACIAPRAGASGWSGMKASQNSFPDGWCLQNHAFRISPPACFLPSNLRGGESFFYGAAAALALNAPRIDQPYQQVMDLVGRTYYSNPTTVGDMTYFTERFDTGYAKAGVVLNDRTASIIGSIQNPSVTSNLAEQKSLRFGVRMMIPIIGHTSPHRGRYGRWRRTA